MSKVKAKKRHSSSSKSHHPKPTKENNAVKRKKKYWKKMPFKKKMLPLEDKEKGQKISPPTDALQFSANWKALQEVRVQLVLVAWLKSIVYLCHIH